MLKASLDSIAVLLLFLTKGLCCCLRRQKLSSKFDFSFYGKVCGHLLSQMTHNIPTTVKKKRSKKQRNSGVFRRNVLKAFALPHQRPLQDDAAFFIALALLCRKLVHPAQFAVAVLAADVPHHVSSGEHDAVLDFTLLQIHNLNRANDYITYL